MNNTLLTILLVFVVFNCITNIVLVDAIYGFHQDVIVPAHQVHTGLIAIKDVVKIFVPSISMFEKVVGLYSYAKSLGTYSWTNSANGETHWANAWIHSANGWIDSANRWINPTYWIKSTNTNSTN
jgi:hypothetical protein